MEGSCTTCKTIPTKFSFLRGKGGIGWLDEERIGCDMCNRIDKADCGAEGGRVWREGGGVEGEGGTVWLVTGCDDDRPIHFGGVEE